MKLKEEGKALNFLVQPEIYEKIKEEADSKYMSVGALLRMIFAERYFSKKG